ncbi:MAG: hypothetical protein H6582_02990 [Crocinitomicaceae bacterium]|nr:hypothetical protein [Crocinitomicaceae bacterium]
MKANEFIQYKKEQLKKDPFMFTKDIGQKGRHRWKIVGRTMKVAEDLDKKVLSLKEWSM